MDVTQQFQSWYSGTPKEKLEQARTLLAVVQRNQCIDAGLQAELAALRKSCEQLNQQMEQMEMGALCTACAKRPNGGCCSAYMADNTDSIQILINLLLEKDIDQRLPEDNECCFLGPRGCLFMAKPIFCLNYNCTHIVQGAAPQVLRQLERCAATVLGQQTAIESMLLECLRHIPLTMA